MQPLKLRKTIKKHGKNGAEDVTVLELADPTGDLVLRHGLPYTSLIEPVKDGGSRIELRMKPEVLAKYIAQMSGIDEALIGALDPRDVLSIYLSLVEYFTGGSADEGN